jgi:elongator complex protein 1
VKARPACLPGPVGVTDNIDKFINVGWGSKSTQFHGSAGKASREIVAPTLHHSHPTDDGLPIITFRGDAAYFAISSLDYYPQSTDARRQVRIYAREASSGFIPKLSATSENLPGLEGAINWRPSGNLISSLVRYGYDGGAPGKEGRWEVAMLERNGLRHGGFELREDMTNWAEASVKALRWNSDSEVLAIWLRRKEIDVGKSP